MSLLGKKKKTLNTETVNSKAEPVKSIDSFFATLSANNAVQCDTKIISATYNSTKVMENETKENETRENVLNNLIQHKILYNHIEIKNRIDSLSENEMTEIFKIIKNNNEKYSINKNGIFINLSVMKKNTIQEISNFLYFCDNNNKAINNEEIERAKYKNMISDS